MACCWWPCPTREILARHPDVVVLREPPETGLVAGYTVGAREARSEHLFFCNEDMWFDPCCLSRLERALDLKKRVGAADPWQWSYDEHHWIHGGVRFRRAFWNINSPFPFASADFTVDLAPAETVPYACAGAFLIHRDVFREIGGWDTSFFLDEEDVDLFLRAWQRDWKCVTVPEAKVYHAVGASNEQELGSRQRMTVRTRRYISSYASKSIIGLKYFTWPAVLLSAGVWLVRFLNNLVKFRPQAAYWDLLVLPEIATRIRSAAGFRRTNAEWNTRKPGQEFFQAPEFLAWP